MPRPSRQDELFAEIAMRHGLLEQEQVDKALKTLERSRRASDTLGDVVRRKKWLSASAVKAVYRALEFREQRLAGKLYGRIAVKNRFATLEQVRTCLEEQKQRYLERKRVPSMSDVMLRHGFVTETQDAAITQAMADLDVEAMVARRPAGGEAEAKEALESAQPFLDDLEPVTGGDDQAAFDAISEDFERVASEPEVPAILEEGEEGEDEEAPEFSDDLEVSENQVIGGDTEQGVLLPGLEEGEESEEPEASHGEFATVSEAAAATAHAGARELETRDEIDALLRPDDLELDAGAALEQDGLESEDETLVLPEAFAVGAPASKPEQAPFEGISDIEGVDELEVFSDSEDQEALPTAQAIDIGIDVTVCPECKVELSAGTTECLYCGHRFVAGPTSNDITDEVLLGEAEELQPVAAVQEALDGAQPQVEAGEEQPEAVGAVQQGLVDRPFSEAFGKAEQAASCQRGRLLHARAADGTWHWVWRLPAGLAPSEEQIEAYLADARALREAGLRHFVPFEWLGRDDEGLYAVYADAPGRPAPECVADGPLDRMQSARIVKHVACACRDAAEAGVLPREFRPEGVLIGEGDAEATVRVVGYGLMRLVEPPAEGLGEIDPDDAFVPPERRRKPDRADVRTGIYGLGALLVLLLTGEPPSAEFPEVPGAMRSFLNKTLSRATGKRYLDFSKVFIDVDRFPGARGLEVQTR